MSATYDNGDKSDNWCGSHTKVPQEIIGPEFYGTPRCDNRNFFAIGDLQIDHEDWGVYIDYVICV
jgi:hypothetical protein